MRGNFGDQGCQRNAEVLDLLNKTLEDARTFQAAQLTERRRRYYELAPATELSRPQGHSGSWAAGAVAPASGAAAEDGTLAGPLTGAGGGS
ncbi:MAG TPA: hypothetical protein VJ725_27185 [Thermoanaerobaculia bacterium]|nr:hypothetical protein [Thermoanaerobaculia bacterium]